MKQVRQEGYTYLGITELDQIKVAEMKDFQQGIVSSH